MRAAATWTAVTAFRRRTAGLGEQILHLFARDLVFVRFVVGDVIKLAFHGP
jgi:hypothetical protein